jgi:hypothetical protein
MKLKSKSIDPYDIAPLIARVKRYADRKGCAISTASFEIFGDGERIKLLEQGKSCTVKTARRAWQKLETLEGKLPQAVSA